MKKIIIAVVALLLIAPVGLYFGGFLPFGGETAAEGEEAGHGEEGAEGGHGEAASASHYLTLDPPFIVNFMYKGSLRYLQVSLDLMYHDESIIEQIKTRMPRIRNDLLLLFSSQDFDLLNTLEGKEKLRGDVLLAVNNALEIDPLNPGPAAEGEVYFTSFVMQ